jgi:hypothetical protein
MPRRNLIGVCGLVLAGWLLMTSVTRAQQQDNREAERLARLVQAREMAEIELQQAVLQLQIERNNALKVQPATGRGPVRLVTAPLQIEYEAVDPQLEELQRRNVAEPAIDLLLEEEPELAKQRKLVIWIAKSNFDQFMFGNLQTDELRRAWLDSLVKEQLSKVSQKHDLTESEMDKLRLAAHGDVKRFFTQVELKRQEFEEARKNRNKGRQFLNELTRFRQSFQTGPYERDSLFYKTLSKILFDRKKAEGNSK